MANAIGGGGGGDPTPPDVIDDGLPTDETRELWRYRFRRPDSDVVYRDYFDGPVSTPDGIPYGSWVIQIDDELSEAATMFHNVYLSTTALHFPAVKLRQVTVSAGNFDEIFYVVSFDPIADDFTRIGGYYLLDAIHVRVYQGDGSGGYTATIFDAFGTEVSYPANPYTFVKVGEAQELRIQCKTVDYRNPGLPVATSYNNYLTWEALYHYESGGDPTDTVQTFQYGSTTSGFAVATGCTVKVRDNEEPPEYDDPFLRNLVLILAGALAAALVILALPELVAVGGVVALGASVEASAVAIEGSAASLAAVQGMSAVLEIEALETVAALRGILGAVETVEISAATARAQALCELAKQEADYIILRASLGP